MENTTTQGAEGHSSASPFQTNLELTLNTMPVSVDIRNPAVLALFCAFLGSTVLRAELVRFARSTSALYAPMRAFAKARPFSAVLGGLVHPLLVPALPPVLRSVVSGIHKDQSDMLVKAFLAPEGREAFSAYVALLMKGSEVGNALVPSETTMIDMLLSGVSMSLQSVESEEVKELVLSVLAENGLTLPTMEVAH